ncbi:Glucose dehydrogenase [FAD, quinone] [Orchesella cincta]|uniref:Glucose dehydrogenase [FAD, quinone] n=1 Tax=Orchesella cincta TaxID=48709 RepID=A0A1D2MA51_ORCCI|nr:Glucose dehydrogenase [FAD, quinone] [Orchesella cincta]
MQNKIVHKMGVVDAVKVILRALPGRWPLPIPVSVFSATFLTLAINSWVAYDMSRDVKTNNELRTKDTKCQFTTFDYIIVGVIYNSGGAGMVVATRIANASSSNRILLLEAGGEPSVLNDIPKSYDHKGKMLGGSTATNFMMYVRGNKEDFNRWSTEDLGGDPQWNYENLLPYFKKSEDYNGAWANEPDAFKYHGKGGLRNVAKCDYHPGAEELFAAALEKGYSQGITMGQIRVKFQTCLESQKLGVVYKRQGLTRIATARKEVILSAGTFESAKILMLSGVGPAEHLRSLNISVVKDLPVGQNLQDHLITLVGPFLKAPAVNPNRDVTAQAAYHYLSTGNGILAASDALAGQDRIMQISSDTRCLCPLPHLPEDMNKMFGVRVDILKKWFDPYHKNDTDARFRLLVLGRPKSFGNLTLASRNPDDNPIMDPQFLTHPDDVEAMLYGFKKFVDLYENTTALNTPLFHKPVPGCEAKEFRMCHSHVLVHTLSSCWDLRFGKGGGWQLEMIEFIFSLLFGHVRVIGIDGLRVIDASVIPREPNANTQAATIMIAEKGSDLIIADITSQCVHELQLLATLHLVKTFETCRMGVVDAVNTILRALPARWPIPIPISIFTATFISLAINSWVSYDISQDATVNSEILTLDSKCQFTTFDYIIVGGGGAGMVVATRIANASSSNRILLLEAGGEPSVLNDIPGLDGFLSNQPANTWFYNSTVQANACQNCDGKVNNDNARKNVGCSTSTNFMMYVRGNKEDFNRWSTEDLGGDPQWNYENLLPILKNLRIIMEFMQATLPQRNTMEKEVFAMWQPMIFSQVLMNFWLLLWKRGIQSGLQWGKSRRDTGKPSNLCIKNMLMSPKSLSNCFRSAKSYFSNVQTPRSHSNSDCNQRNHPQRWGYILTFGSAKLLMLSGVGPAEHLGSLNAAVSYLSTGNGVLAASEALAVIQASFGLYPQLPQDLNRMVGIRADILDNWFDPYHKTNTDARFCLLIAGRPKSFGNMTLASTNPDDNPIQDPQYLANPDDVEAMLFGFKKIVDLYENTAALNTSLFLKPVPGCESLVFKSDDYYRCVIRMFSFTIYHHVGSCSLGKVVDSQLKVKGIDGLRVIDASVMPRLPNGNTQAATIMIAEKGSDLIIADM